MNILRNQIYKTNFVNDVCVCVLLVVIIWGSPKSMF